MGICVEGAKEALALVAKMKGLNSLIAIIAVFAFPAEVLQCQDVVLKICCGGYVVTRHAAQRTLDRGFISRTLEFLFCTALADRVEASLQ